MGVFFVPNFLFSFHDYLDYPYYPFYSWRRWRAVHESSEFWEDSAGQASGAHQAVAELRCQKEAVRERRRN